MPVSCVIYGCSNRYKPTKSTLFFVFPSAKHQEQRRKLWIAAVKRVGKHGKPWIPSKHSRVCSDHFITGRPSKYKGHPDFVPNKFVYSNKIRSTSRFERLNRRSTAKANEDKMEGQAFPSQAKQTIEYSEAPAQELQTTLSGLDITSTEKEIAESLLLLSSAPVPASQVCSVHEDKTYYLLNQEIETLQQHNENLRAELQLLKKVKLSLNNIRNDDVAFRYYTGLVNASIFDALLLYLREKAEALTYWYGKKTNLCHTTLPSVKKTKCNRQTTLEEEFFMVLVRLRTGMPIQEVTRNFQITKSTFSSIFTTWVMFLAKELKQLTRFPTLNDVKQHLPDSFQEFNNTRVVLDATEVRIQRPSTRSAQKKTFSNYKHFNTFKVLVGCTPDGYLCFVSSLWSASISDKELVLKSELLDYLVPGDAIMVDKGFTIKDILPPGVQLHIPAFHKVTNGQMPTEDLMKTKKVASARVHVERLIRRVKEFHILDKPFPLVMLDIAEEVFHVCAYLVNFQGPLINS